MGGGGVSEYCRNLASRAKCATILARIVAVKRTRWTAWGWGGGGGGVGLSSEGWSGWWSTARKVDNWRFRPLARRQSEWRRANARNVSRRIFSTFRRPPSIIERCCCYIFSSVPYSLSTFSRHSSIIERCCCYFCSSVPYSLSTFSRHSSVIERWPCAYPLWHCYSITSELLPGTDSLFSQLRNRK